MTSFSQFGRPDPECDDVYAAIASALRCTPGMHAGQRTRGRMTKARVAAVHRKILAGEALDGDREQDIAARLCQQLGVPEGPHDGAGPIQPGGPAE